MCAGVGFKGLADVVGGHCCDEFEEGDHGDEVGCVFVLRRAGPFREDDGIFGLQAGVGGVGVYDEGFGEVAVEVGEVLFDICQ